MVLQISDSRLNRFKRRQKIIINLNKFIASGHACFNPLKYEKGNAVYLTEIQDTYLNWSYPNIIVDEVVFYITEHLNQKSLQNFFERYLFFPLYLKSQLPKKRTKENLKKKEYEYLKNIGNFIYCCNFYKYYPHLSKNKIVKLHVKKQKKIILKELEEACKFSNIKENPLNGYFISKQALNDEMIVTFKINHQNILMVTNKKKKGTDF